MSIYSVRIIKKENQIAAAEYIKQFFMFCGVYVEEAIIDKKHFNESWRAINEDVVNCNIWLAKNTQDFEGKWKAGKNVMLDVEEDINLSDAEKRRDFGLQIEDDIVGMFYDTECEEKADIVEVYEVFVNNDIAYLNFLSHLYIKQMKTDETDMTEEYEENRNFKQRIYNAFWTCIDALLVNDSVGSVYKRFAYLNCMRKVNRVCTENRRIFDFNNEAVMREAHKLSEEDRKFSSGNTLAFLVGILEYETEMKAEKYLLQASECERGKRYFSFVFYEFGWFCEMIKHDWKIGAIWYKKMGDLTPESVKFKFKDAANKFRCKKYKDSWEGFLDIYHEMQRKDQGGWMTLQEAEYYYRSAAVLTTMAADGRYDASEIHLDDVLRCIDKNKIVENFVDKDDRNAVRRWYLAKVQR